MTSSAVSGDHLQWKHQERSTGEENKRKKKQEIT